MFYILPREDLVCTTRREFVLYIVHIIKSGGFCRLALGGVDIRFVESLYPWI